MPPGDARAERTKNAINRQANYAVASMSQRRRATNRAHMSALRMPALTMLFMRIEYKNVLNKAFVTLFVCLKSSTARWQRRAGVYAVVLRSEC